MCGGVEVDVYRKTLCKYIVHNKWISNSYAIIASILNLKEFYDRFTAYFSTVVSVI